MNTCLLVVAKAPVPGRVKTRLCPPLSHEQAADLAAAALLDTLDNVFAAPGLHPVVACTGDFRYARRRTELLGYLARVRVIRQRGTDFGTRLANAHHDVAALYPGVPVLQIGMDTPQLCGEQLGYAAGLLHGAETDGVLGPAEDGGWWGLGLRDPHAAGVLREVPMSRADTGALTGEALRSNGIRVHELATMSDVDTFEDALRVARLTEGRFADAVPLSRTAR